MTNVRIFSNTPNPSVITYYLADVKNATDYSGFGVKLYNRGFSFNDYRYGFNGQESDFEIENNSSMYTASYWEYDSRLGRRWNIDPVVKPFFSGYSTFANNPLYFVDPKGSNEWHPETGEDGTTALVADAGDNAQTLAAYGTKNGLDFTTEEMANLTAQIAPCASGGDIQGLALQSPKFDNIPGKNLMREQANNPESGIFPGDRGFVCSPTTFLRADQATELAYEKDVLGKVGGQSYRAWNMWEDSYILSPGLITAKKEGAVGVMTYLGIGTKVSAQQAMMGGLKPGAILNLTHDNGRGGHSAIFHSYRFDAQGNINGFNFWQAHDGEGGNPSGSNLGSGKFGNNDEGFSFGAAANFK
jgi:hypothetical protein